MKNRFLSTLLLFLCLTAINSTYAQKSETPQELVIEFLDIVERDAYTTTRIDWDSVRPAFIEETKHITDIRELEPYFDKVLKQLKDYHSDIFYSEGEDDGDEDENVTLKLYATTTYKEAGFPDPNFNHELIDGKYGYINFPMAVLERRRYIETIGEQLHELDEKNPKAWIFDVTENQGGVTPPMLWQMYYLIDQDEIYSFVDNKGEEEVETKKQWEPDTTSEIDMQIFEWARLNDESLIPKELDNTDIPIVILTSAQTASAAEFFVGAFKGQKNVTVIGQKTTGLTSGNVAYDLGKNYVVNLTTAVMKDRAGKVYKIAEGIDPDIYFEIEKGLTLEDHEKREVKQKYIDEAVKFLDTL